MINNSLYNAQSNKRSQTVSHKDEQLLSDKNKC